MLPVFHFTLRKTCDIESVCVSALAYIARYLLPHALFDVTLSREKGIC